MKHKCSLFPKKAMVNATKRMRTMYKKRGGIGTKNFRINDKTGDVVAVEVVHNDDEVMLISNKVKSFALT